MPYGLYVFGSRGTDPAVKQLMTANWAIVLPGEHVGFDVDDEGWPTDLGTDTVWRSRRAVTAVRATRAYQTLPEALVKSGLPSSRSRSSPANRVISVSGRRSRLGANPGCVHRRDRVRSGHRDSGSTAAAMA